jgi:hypothetical protein
MSEIAAGTVSSVSGGGTWVHPAGCAGTDSTAGSSDVAYSLSSTSGATTVTVTHTLTSMSDVVNFAEYSFTGTSVSFDACNNRDQSTAAANIAGATLGSLTGTNDVIVQIGSFAGTASGCGSQGGTNGNPSAFPTGDAFCGFINTTTTTANTYASSSGRAALSVIAMKENTGGTATRGKAIVF